MKLRSDLKSSLCPHFLIFNFLFFIPHFNNNLIMKKILLSALLASITSFLCAQDIDKILNAKEAERIEKILSDNNMEGRKVFTPGIDRAAAFIASEFNAIGLQP